MRTSIIVAPLLMLVITPVSVISQPPKTTEPGRDLESDAVSLLPTSIKQTTLELTIDGRTISVPVQYAVRGTDTKDRPTLFVLPVWIAVEVERVIEGPKDRQRTRLSPSDPLVPPGETRPVQLNVTVRNLLDNPATEKLIVNHLKQYVAEQLGLDQPAFRYEKPHINEAAVRFTLIGRGRGNEPEIVLSNAVPSADGLLGFDLDIAAIRRCEQLHALSGGLAVGNVTIMASGPIKVRFERLEMEAQVRYLRSALADLRKRVGSAVNPAGPPPDVIIPLTAGSTAEVQNHIAAMLQQSLRVTVSTRQGSTDLPLLRFLEKATDNLLRLSEIDTTHDQQRLTFLLDNQVSITATLGELKRLSRLDEKGRAEAFRQAYDHFTASRRDELSSRSNTVGVGFAFWSARYSDSYSQHQSQTDVARHQQEEQQLRQAFDRVMQLFEGNVKFPTGLHLDDRVLSSSLKDVQTEFTQRSFFYDFTLHRFAPIRLMGSTDVGSDLATWMRNYAQLRAEHEALLARLKQAVTEHERLDKSLKAVQADLETTRQKNQELVAQVEALIKAAGKPEEWIEIRARMEKVAKLVSELEQKLASVEKTLGGSGAALLAEVRKELTELQQQHQQLHFALSRLRRGTEYKGLALTGHNGAVNMVAYSPDGKVIASGSDDRTVRLWEASTGKLLRTLEGHSNWVWAVAFSPDGKVIASASSDRTVRLWEASTGKLLRTLEGHSNWVWAVAFSPDGKVIASASEDHTVCLWDAQTGKLLRTFEGHGSEAVAVAFSPDGKVIASGFVDRTVRLWDAQTGKLLRILEGHGDGVWALSFSPDGKVIVSGSWDRTVRLWEASTGKLLLTLEGHSDSVRALSFSPDGKVIVSGSWDRTVRLWEASTGKLLLTLEGHSDRVQAVAFSPDGRSLVVGLRDNTMRIWDLD